MTLRARGGPKRQRGVFERPPGSGIWWISYFGPDGKRHREKVGRYAAAVDAYFERKLAVREGQFRAPRAAGIRFEDLLAQAFADRRQRLSPFTVASDQSKSGQLLAWFGPLPAARITAPMIADRLRELVDRSLAGPTANRYQALLSAIFAWGVRAGRLTENPARGVQKYRESEARVRFLDREEEAALRKVIRQDYPAAEAEFDLALNTGMRRNELYRLTWDQVDLERGILTVQGKAHANSRQSARRFLPLNPQAAAALAELRERSNGSACVCPGPHDGTATERDWRDWFEASVRKAGIDNFRYHDLRHTFASRLVMEGVPLVAVMEFLGHRSIAMVLRYAHLAPDHQRDNMAKLGKYAPAAPAAVLAMPPAKSPRSGTSSGTTSGTRRKSASGDRPQVYENKSWK